jgi:hypothetical protein
MDWAAWSEYVEHVRCTSTISLDRNRNLERVMDIRKTPNKYCKYICPILGIKCFGILIGLWNEWPESRGLMPGGSHEFYLCLFVNTGSDLTRTLVQRTSGFYTAVNQSGHAVSNSHPISSRCYKTLHSDRQRSRKLQRKFFKFICGVDRRYQMKAIFLRVCFLFETGHAVLSTFSITVCTIWYSNPDRVKKCVFSKSSRPVLQTTFLLFDKYKDVIPLL